MFPACPEAPISNVSEVDVSPSTVIALKVRSVISDVSFCRAAGLTAASVKM